MRTAVYYSNRDLRIEERPIPPIGPGEILVRVEAAGICGSDVMEWYRIDRVPLILGHEVAGVIAAVGPGVKAHEEGERVVLAHHVPCGECPYCLSGHETVCDTLRKTNFDPGGFAEYVRLLSVNTEKGVFRLPEQVSFEEGTFVEPLACCLRGQRLAGGVKGRSVLVLGSGIAGILHIHLARVCGAACIVATDIVEYRRTLAEQFGADYSVDAAAYSAARGRELNGGRLFDCVIVSTGAGPALEQAMLSVERGGTILFFAPTQSGQKVPVPFNELFWRNEITLTSSYAGTPQEYQQALEIIAAGRLRLSEMITHRLPLAQIGEGFRLVAEGADSLKVIIYPQK